MYSLPQIITVIRPRRRKPFADTGPDLGLVLERLFRTEKTVPESVQRGFRNILPVLRAIFNRQPLFGKWEKNTPSLGLGVRMKCRRRVGVKLLPTQWHNNNSNFNITSCSANGFHCRWGKREAAGAPWRRFYDFPERIHVKLSSSDMKHSLKICTVTIQYNTVYWLRPVW